MQQLLNARHDAKRTLALCRLLSLTMTICLMAMMMVWTIWILLMLLPTAPVAIDSSDPGKRSISILPLLDPDPNFCRARNKLHARKSRQRKKLLMESLKHESSILSQQVSLMKAVRDGGLRQLLTTIHAMLYFENASQFCCLAGNCQEAW